MLDFNKKEIRDTIRAYEKAKAEYQYMIKSTLPSLLQKRLKQSKRSYTASEIADAMGIENISLVTYIARTVPRRTRQIKQQYALLDDEGNPTDRKRTITKKVNEYYCN